MTHKLDRRLVFFLLALLLAFSVLLFPSVVFAEEPADCAGVEAAGQDDFQAEDSFTPTPDAVSPPVELEVIESEPTPSQATPTGNEVPASGEVTPADESADESAQTESATFNDANGDCYIATITPDGLVHDAENADTSFTISFTEIGESRIGSAQVTIPDGFVFPEESSDFYPAFDPDHDISVPEGKSWYGALVGNVLSLWALNADSYLYRGETVSASFTATPPLTRGIYDFATEAWTDASFEGDGGVGDDPNAMAVGYENPVVTIGIAINDAGALAMIGNDENYLMDDHYVQTGNIDLGVEPYNIGEGWEPIGYLSYWDGDAGEYGEQIPAKPFTGSYNGGGFEIRNLFINRPELIDGAGLFGLTGDLFNHALLLNISLVGASVTGQSSVGILVGENWARVINCSTTGTVTGVNAGDPEDGTGNSIGGLLGSNGWRVVGSSADVEVAGNNAVGGLIGSSGAIVTYNQASGNVTGNEKVGGLVGHYSSVNELYNCSATGSVTGNNYVGGLLGESNRSVHNSYAKGDVSGLEYVGGLVGSSWSDGEIGSSYAEGDVTGNQYVGGLFGYAGGNIGHSSYTGNIVSGVFSGGVSQYVGGLAGWITEGKGAINSFVTGAVSGYNYVGGLFGHAAASSYSESSHVSGDVSGNDYIGGLVGYYEGSNVSNSYMLGNVSGNDYVGGLIGYRGGNNPSFIDPDEDIFASGQVSGHDYVGGLIGYQKSGELIDAFATGPVNGANYIGGLVGYSEASIKKSFATGNVTGLGNYVGGLTGYNDGAVIENCYTTGAAEGLQYVGGLSGYNNTASSIDSAYAAGLVTGDFNTGGLVGFNQGTGNVINSYYDKDTTGKNDNTGKGTPKTTAEMKSGDPLTGFDQDVWVFDAGEYPQLSKYHFAGGYGIPDAPFLVATAGHLNAVRFNLEKHFLQVDHITLDIAPFNQAEGWLPIGIEGSPFKGSYDGNGYTIGALMINRPATDYIGLFGYVENHYGGLEIAARIDNVILKNISVLGREFVGALAGYMNGSQVDGCAASGNLTATGNSAGGLVGLSSHGSIITDSAAEVAVNGVTKIGGLVGFNYHSSVQNSYAAGSVTGEDSVGGLIGYND